MQGALQTHAPFVHIPHYALNNNTLRNTFPGRSAIRRPANATKPVSSRTLFTVRDSHFCQSNATCSCTLTWSRAPN